MPLDLERLKVVAIFFWGRSGSVFLHSLFDSHPQVLTIPATRLNAFHGRQWADICQAPGSEAMARRFVAWNPSVFDGRLDRWFEGLDAMGPGRDQAIEVDAEAFVRHVTRLLDGPREVTRRRFFLALHVAYALARGEDVSDKTTIVYHLHSPEAYAGIDAALADFPELRAVGITREPVRSLLSYLRKNVLVARAWQLSDRTRYAQLAPTGGYNFVYRHHLIGWRELLARHPLPFRSLSIEKLNQDTEAQMRPLATFLGLRWDPCLTRSTFNGLPYHGETLVQAQPSAGPPAPSNAESDAALDTLDRYVLEGLLANFRRELGYGETPIRQRVLSALLVPVPTRVERLALAEALRGAPPLGPAPEAAPSATAPPARAARLRATLQQILERQRYSYRHLLCELVPAVRAHLPAPKPLSPGLSLPTAASSRSARPATAASPAASATVR
jgi:sulfotransferase family protein